MCSHLQLSGPSINDFGDQENISTYSVVPATSPLCSKSFTSLGRGVAWVSILPFFPLSRFIFFFAASRVSNQWWGEAGVGVPSWRRAGMNRGECVFPTALCLPYYLSVTSSNRLYTSFASISVLLLLHLPFMHAWQPCRRKVTRGWPRHDLNLSMKFCIFLVCAPKATFICSYLAITKSNSPCHYSKYYPSSGSSEYVSPWYVAASQLVVCVSRFSSNTEEGPQ